MTGEIKMLSISNYDFKISFNNLVFHIWSYNPPIYHKTPPETYAHSHFHSEFHYVYEGKENIYFKDHSEPLEVSKDEFCVIPSGIYHALSIEKNTIRECFFLDIEYSDSFADDYSDYYVLNNIIKEEKNISIFKDDFIKNSMENFKLLYEKDKNNFTLSQKLMLANVITRFFEKNISKDAFKSPISKDNLLKYNRRRIIEEFISDSYKLPNAAAELSKRLFLSERQTLNVVKKLFSEDLKTLIVRQRIQTANAIIKTSNLSFEEIAEFVGYSSYSGFYMAYKKENGFSPNEARKKNQP